MSSGSMPSYDYRPAIAGVEPSIRTRSTRRARLWAGGTYFRVREPGWNGNNIFITAIEYTSEIPGEEGELKGKLVVLNTNTLYSENVTGPADVNLLTQSLAWNEFYQIEELTATPTARKYGISWQISTGKVLEEDLGPFNFSRLFTVPSKLSVKLTPRTSEFTPEGVIVIQPRIRVYDLVSKTVTPEPGEEGGSTDPQTGWDIEALRELVNASDPWIEMLERSGTPDEGEGGAPPIPPTDPADVQDDGVDEAFLTPFSLINLSGGDGLPDTPSGERTGPSRSLIHINYGETKNGSLAEVNEVYEWAGDSTSAGSWKRY